MRRLIIVVVLALGGAGCGARDSARVSPGQELAISLGTPAERRAAFASAYQLMRRGDEVQALPMFRALATGYPELGDHALYIAGTIAARGGDPAAEADFLRLLLQYPQSVKAPAAALALGELLLRAGRLDEARLQLQRASEVWDTATEQRARLALAEVDERGGNYDAAYAGYTQVRRAMLAAAPGRAAKERILALRERRPDLAPRGYDLLAEARLLVTERDLAAAERAADQLLIEGVVEPAAALRVRADALYGRGDLEAALACLRSLVDRYGFSDEAPGALFRLASIRWNRDHDEIALNLFAEFRRRYTHDQRAPEAVYAMARIHQSAGRNRRAVENYRELLRLYPRSNLVDEAHWRLGWMRYVSGDWEGAVEWFERLAARRSAPLWRRGARYWQARALGHAGRTYAARALYRDIIGDDGSDYYALWAERRLNEVPGPLLLAARSRASLPAAALPAVESIGLPSLPAAELFHFSRWAELRAAGVLPLAREELRAVERERPDDVTTQRYLLQAYASVDGYAAAQHLLRRLGSQAGLSAWERQRVLYPLAFWEIVSRGAQANGVDPLLVVAVMRQESLFDPQARSAANAYGLMQLLPQTAAQLAAGRPLDQSTLFEPEINVELGTRYLSGLLSRFGGDVLRALAAYNGGEASVRKWEQRFGGLEPDEFVESITYRETRDYVKRVLSNYRAYEQIYGADRPSASTAG